MHLTTPTYVVDETRQRDDHLAPHYHIENNDRVELVIVVALLDVIEVEQADSEEQSSVPYGHNDEGNATDVAHLSVELEVAFPAKRLMSPLYNPGHRMRNHDKNCKDEWALAIYPALLHAI